jgi:hypothetical protein
MKHLFCTGLILAISICSFSQKEFYPGWLVKTNGDTLKGYLQEEVRKNIIETIKFKPLLDSSSFILFTVAEAKSFKYDGGNLYQLISFENSSQDLFVKETLFARQLVGGGYNLYEILRGETSFYVITDGSDVYFLFNSLFNPAGELEKAGNYTNTLIHLATACNGPNLSPERVEYTDREMIKFVLELNSCISPDKAAINYYHKPKTQVQFFVYGGGLPLGNRSEVAVQALVKIVYPQLNPNMSFNFGIHYSNTIKPVLRRDYTYTKVYTQTNYKITSFPLFVQYNFTRGIIQPYIYAGASAAYLNVNPDNPFDPYYQGDEIYGNHEYNFEPLGGVGIEAYFTSWFMARIDWRYEYTFQLPTIGLALKF